MKNIITKLLNFFNEIAPVQGQYSWFDKLRISLGAGLTIFVVMFFAYLWGDLSQDESMVVAVFGVSALCIFLFPDSKFFAPLILIEANLLASCVAFICVYIFSTVDLGIPFAIIGTIMGMYFLGCMHPPAIFLSIFIVMAGTSSYDFAIYPVLADSCVLALASLVNKTVIKHWGSRNISN